MYTILKCRALGPDETITKTTGDEPSSARFSRGATIPCADAPAPPARLGARHGRIPGDFWLVYWPTPVIDLVRLSPRGVPTAPPSLLVAPFPNSAGGLPPLISATQPAGRVIRERANGLCMCK